VITSAYALAANVSGATTTTPVTVDAAGRYVLVLLAGTYDGTTGFLQVLGPDASTWISLNATKYSANQVTSYDLPSGQYRMSLGSSTAGLYATLVRCPY